MSDIKVVSVSERGRDSDSVSERGRDSDCDKHEKHEKHDRDCDCHVDHVTIGGRGSRKHPFKAIGLPNAAAFGVKTTTIYVRPGGKDKSGRGSSPDKALATLQFALTQVPNILPSGEVLVFDVTGINETLPDGYHFPIILSSGIFTGSNGGPFINQSSINILAIPEAAPLSPASDATIPAGSYILDAGDPVSGLVTLTLLGPARASWAGSALKGKLLISDGGPSQGSVAIADSTANTLLLAALPSQIGGNLTISQPSATLRTANPADFGGINVNGITAIWFGGINFVCDNPFAAAIALASVPCSPLFELCTIGGITAAAAGFTELQFNGCVLTNQVNLEPSALFPFNTLFLGCSMYLAGGGHFMQTCVVDSCAPLGAPAFPSAISYVFTPSWSIQNVLIKNGTAQGLLAGGGGYYQLQNVKIQGCAGDAIYSPGLVTLALNNVGGGTGAAGDPANGGYGVHLNDGASARVLDTATNVSGVLGDIKVGSLNIRGGNPAAGAGWNDLRTAAPINNEYDLVTPFVVSTNGTAQPGGDSSPGVTDTSGGNSGSRLFQRSGV